MENTAKSILKIFDEYDESDPVQAVIGDDLLKEWAHILKEVPERIDEVPDKVLRLYEMVKFLNDHKDDKTDADIDIERVLCLDYADVAIGEDNQIVKSSGFNGGFFYEIIRLPALETFTLLYDNKFELSVEDDAEMIQAMAEFDATRRFTDDEADLIDDKYLTDLFKGEIGQGE